MIKPCPSRGFYFLQFCFILGLLSYAYYLESVQGLMPCLLCEVQRMAFGLLGFFLILASLLRFKRFWLVTVNFFCALISLLGMAFSARQLWLQYLPPAEGSGSCDANMGYLWDVLPLADFLETVFIGGPQCAKVTWQFLGLSLAGWAFICFSAFFLLAIWQLIGWVAKKN